jgi:hypothetical protein
MFSNNNSSGSSSSSSSSSHRHYNNSYSSSNNVSATGVVTPSVTESLMAIHNRPLCQSPSESLQQNWNIFSPSIQKSLVSGAVASQMNPNAPPRPIHQHSISAGGPIRSSSSSYMSRYQQHYFNQPVHRNNLGFRHSVSLPIDSSMMGSWGSASAAITATPVSSTSVMNADVAATAPISMNRNTSSSSSSSVASPVLNSYTSSIPSPLQQEIQLETLDSISAINNPSILKSDCETSSNLSLSPQSLFSSPNSPYFDITSPPLAFGRLEHLQQVQTEQQLHRCKICGKDFYEIDQLREHIKAHTKNAGRHLCTYCGVTFGRKHDLIRHEKSHDRSKQEFCHHCDKGKSET